MQAFVIFPNTLFKNVNLSKYQVFIIEDPAYFITSTNRVKLAYMRATMKFYENYLQSKKYNVKYIDYAKVGSYQFLQKFSTVECYDPVDYVLIETYKKLGINLKYHIETPMFIASSDFLQKYYEKTKNAKHISNGDFFKCLKSHLHILDGVKSYDKENRKPIPSKIIIENPLYRSKYHDEAIKYITKHPSFQNNLGDLQSIHSYPVTFQQANNQLDDFIEKKLKHFGDYQDAIDNHQVFLYHSSLSCTLNNGLITPNFVINKVMIYWNANKTKVGINNVEGFVRQLGWREYMHFIYKYYYDELVIANHWNANTRIVDWKPWYQGKTGIDTLDHEIRKCANYGYSHHIVRLMMFLNIFVLCGIHPHDIVKWFMDVCAIDAYPWVMWANIISMGWFSPKFMKKPYVSTERYIINMSKSKKKECLIWKSLFYNFLLQNKNKLIGTSRIYLRNLASIENKPELIKIYTNTAKNFNQKSFHQLSN